MRDRIDRTDVLPLVLIGLYAYVFEHWFAVAIGLLALAGVVVLMQRRSRPLVVTALQFGCVALLLLGGTGALLGVSGGTAASSGSSNAERSVSEPPG